MIKKNVIDNIDLNRDIDEQELVSLIDREVLKCGDYISIGKKIELKKEIFDSIRGLDILQELVDDPDITEIMVNGKENIFIEKYGTITKTNLSFSSETKLQDIIQQIVSKVNRRVNESTPIVDTRLQNGSRVNIVLNPIALDGPVITIRRFPDKRLGMNELIELGAITEEAAEMLRDLVVAGYNIFISGGTGSGKMHPQMSTQYRDTKVGF